MIKVINSIKYNILPYADLSHADLSHADLSHSDLRRSILTHSNISYTDLAGAKLRDAELIRAILVGARLSGTDLRLANLTDADLTGADISGANLDRTIGDGVHIITITKLQWWVNYTSSSIQIGCQNHSIQDWCEFTDDVIKNMGVSVLKWWKKNKGIIFTEIQLNPAKG